MSCDDLKWDSWEFSPKLLSPVTMPSVEETTSRVVRKEKKKVFLFIYMIDRDRGINAISGYGERIYIYRAEN